MCEDLLIGGEIQFKHIDFNVKIPAPFTQKKIGMIAGVFTCCVVILLLSLSRCGFSACRYFAHLLVMSSHAITGGMSF
jgi:hypothetical protein